MAAPTHQSCEPHDGTGADVDFVMPVYNEGENVERALEEIYTQVPGSKRVLIVYDFDEDNTLPVARRLQLKYSTVHLVKNTIGRGVLNAIRAGIAATRAEIVIITMADLSDDLSVVPEMVSLIRDRGFDIVCASRYVRGGRQVGGPPLKGFLSRMAGLCLHGIAGLPTHDATNAFRAYRRSVLLTTPIESRGGFEYSLELTVKAHRAGYRVTEVPSVWRDRSAGQSRFRLRAWLPEYLRWFGWAMDHSPRANGLALTLLLVVGLLLGCARIALRPDLIYRDSYVTGKAGNQLYRSARLIDGALLYRDVACQYGPIPVYAHAALAAVFGNTITTSQTFHLTLSLVCLGLAFAVLRRTLNLGLSLGLSGLVGIPLLLMPGGLIGGHAMMEYPSWERAALMLLMLLWQPPGERVGWRSVGLGLVFGYWQGVKFGGAAFGLVSLACVDLLSMAAQRQWKPSAIGVRSWLVILGTFGLVQLGWMALAYGLLPPEVCYDTLWPAYMVPTYEVVTGSRVPQWQGIQHFLTHQLLLVVCGGLGLLALVAAVRQPAAVPRRNPREPSPACSLALGAFFLLFAAQNYLEHEPHYEQAAYLLMFPAAWGLTLLALHWKLLLGLSAVPTWAVLLVITFVLRPQGERVSYQLPDGETLIERPEVGRELEMLAGLSALRTTNEEFDVVLFDWSGGGYYHFFNPAFPLRNSIFEPLAFRPYDDDQLASRLALVRTVVVQCREPLPTESERQSLADRRIRATFSAAVADRITAEFQFDRPRSIGRYTVLVRRMDSQLPE
jgi:dolichol-phosphate mannosyltransferase